MREDLMGDVDDADGGGGEKGRLVLVGLVGSMHIKRERGAKLEE